MRNKIGSIALFLSALTLNVHSISGQLTPQEAVKSMMKSNPVAGLTSGQPIGFFLEVPANAATLKTWTVSFGEDSSSKTTYNYTLKSKYFCH